MNLLPFFQWCEATSIGAVTRESVWLFALVEAVHLLGLAVIGGSILLVDMRMLTLLLPNRGVGELAREARPWFNRSLIVMLITGVVLFLSEAVKCYNSVPFWVKMWSLSFALIFTYTIRWRVISAEEGRFSAGTQKLVALVSLALWLGVGGGGRWIGFGG